ncbi:Fic family protein [Arthrobacter sp. H5]|uniref:Fic family protein n=1 Tax=Arthrobacter sp. H5 TaxID=1267973 RepID=UPI0004BCB022|nr:Fic family protein [Arthrobacter sp. H5]
MLLRSGSASSSEIEHLTAQPKSIALAELGVKAGHNARLIVANTRAMEAAIALSVKLDCEAVLAMQNALLGDTHPEYTGKWREQQVWVGGGMSNSPHPASFVPPHHHRIPQLMNDFVSFAGRADMPILPQIAVAHAQFETIHPFPDGNGRTGRAIVHSMLHRLGITRNVTIPVSAGLLQNTAGYFDALTAYRKGNVAPIVDVFSWAFVSALANGRALIVDLEAFRSWAGATTSARRGSAGWRTIEYLLKQPVIDANSVASELGVTTQNAQLGIDRLVRDAILHPSGEGRRNRRYEARPALAAVDAFAKRARRPPGQ